MTSHTPIRAGAALTLVFGFVMSAAHAADEGFTFIPEVNIYNKSTKFKDKTGAVSVDTSVLTGEVALTVTRGALYASLRSDQSLNTKSSADEGGLIVDTNREDFTLNFGYSIGELSVFAGYKDGESRVISYDIAAATYSLLNFRDKGPFVGVGYGINTERYGGFALNAAYAQMQGTVEKGSSLPSAGFSASGDTTGFALGIGWRYPISQNQFLQVGYKTHRYDFKSPVIDYSQNFDILQFGLAIVLE